MYSFFLIQGLKFRQHHTPELKKTAKTINYLSEKEIYQLI